MVSLNIDKTIAKNLRRIRERAGLTQSELGAKIGAADSRISAYETGREGMGKDYIERICKALDVAPWEFFVEIDTPIIRDAAERSQLEFLRRAEASGVAERMLDYGAFEMTRVREAKNRPVPISFSEKEREALRLYEQAEKLGLAHHLDAYAKELLEGSAAKKSGKPRDKAKGRSRCTG